jgi:hypothetical protein
MRLYLVLVVKPSQWLLTRHEFTWLVNVTTGVAVVSVGVSTYVDDPSPSPGMRQFAERMFDPLWYLDLVIVLSTAVPHAARLLAIPSLAPRSPSALQTL